MTDRIIIVGPRNGNLLFRQNCTREEHEAKNSAYQYEWELNHSSWLEKETVIESFDLTEEEWEKWNNVFSTRLVDNKWVKLEASCLFCGGLRNGPNQYDFDCDDDCV